MELKCDFNRDSREGQMIPKEREAMYNVLIENRCNPMLEIGTWKGGGSTYVIACAAQRYGGILHTIEIEKSNYDYAKKLYADRMNILEPHVVFYHADALDMVPRIRELINPLMFLFLDGKEDAVQTYQEYSMVKDLFVPGSIVGCHDWKTEKMRLMKDVLMNDKVWENIVLIEDTITGFAMFKKRGNSEERQSIII